MHSICQQRIKEIDLISIKEKEKVEIIGILSEINIKSMLVLVASPLAISHRRGREVSGSKPKTPNNI